MFICPICYLTSRFLNNPFAYGSNTKEIVPSDCFWHNACFDAPFAKVRPFIIRTIHQ
jgi:hypothetical protein